MKNLAIATAFAVAAVSPQAFAEAPQEVRSIEVEYGDLNLSDARDADRMLTRINQAAKRACMGGTERMSIQERREFRSCKEQSTAHAVSRLAAPTVEAAYNEKNGRSPLVVASR